MKNQFLSIFVIALVTITTSFGQQVQKVETRNLASYGMKKFNEAPKKIFIQDFFINYQMLYDQVEIARGGREAGGGLRSNAKAQLVLGVQGVSEKDLQEITDKLYADYVSKLKSKGFIIVSAEEVSKTERFKDWQLLEGGTPSKAQFPGYVTTAPTGFKFLNKKVSEKGKLKKKSIFDNGMGTSKDLDGIIVARVNMIIPFMKDAESQGSKALVKSFGGVAKVVARPELSIIESTSVETKGVLGPKVVLMNTSSLFAYKESLKKQATLNVIPKKRIVIKDVFEDKKYKAVKSASQDLWGTNYGAIRVFRVSDQVKSIMQAIPCESSTYKKGVLDASGQYLDKSLHEFFKYIK